MTLRSPPSSPAPLRRRPARRLLAACCAIAALCSWAAAAEAASPSGAPRGNAAALRGTAAKTRPGASTYPAGATRPRIIARPSEFARAAKRAPAHKKKPRKPALRGNPARALLAFQAMQKYYYLQGSGLYAGEPFSYLWPFSQALTATVTLANVPHMPVSFARELRARLVGLQSYLDTNNSGAPEGTFTSTLAAFD